MANKICSVVAGILEPDEGLTISLESPQWLQWLENHQSFRYCPSSNESPFTARREGQYWYGYRKQQGKLHKRYIGKALELTVNRLEEIASLLNAPTEPRPTKHLVTEPEVTKRSVTQTNDDIARLWQAIGELRQSLAALGKSKAR